VMLALFSKNLYINKVINNFLILLVLKFHGRRPFGLRVTPVQSLSLQMLALWNFWTVWKDGSVWASYCLS
jgi:hypothetical protein